MSGTTKPTKISKFSDETREKYTEIEICEDCNDASCKVCNHIYSDKK